MFARLIPLWLFKQPIYHFIEKTLMPKEHQVICACGDKKELSNVELD